MLIHPETSRVLGCTLQTKRSLHIEVHMGTFNCKPQLFRTRLPCGFELFRFKYVLSDFGYLTERTILNTVLLNVH